MNLDRAKQIFDEIGFYSDIEEILPNPYIPNPWGGEFEKQVEYEVRCYDRYSDLVFFEGGRAFRVTDFNWFRKPDVPQQKGSDDV